ncbi:MAG: ABC transporter ATP-binding protein [Pseudomonadota bacterium]
MSESAHTKAPQLELRGIRKEFPGCIANDDVSLLVQPGEIHALLGENGAGKSTLVKIIYGVLRADQGEMLWEGRAVTVSSPKAARELGLGMVFQHFSLFEAMSVAENIALGIQGKLDMKGLSDDIRHISESYGLPLNPDRMVHSLSVGERQRIEIVRCLINGPKLLIMDEPTSVLTPQEVEQLFKTLRRLADEGCAVLYISHKLEEIVALCHRATILRGGWVVNTCDPRQETARNMAQMMIGQELKTPEQGAAKTSGSPALVVRNLSLVSADAFGMDLKDISFEARSGEIVGIAGVAGNGQIELLSALTGESRLADSASVEILGQPAGHLNPRARRALGAAFVPEERLGHGAVPSLTLVQNAYLSGYERMGLTRGGFIQNQAQEAYAAQVIADFDVRTTGPSAPASSLSGGNLQKFIVGREILQDPKLIVISQPTWGVDAGAAAAIHQALMDLSGRGAAVVVISQDLDEIYSLVDRFLVINEGRLSQSLDPRTATVEEIGLLMGGFHGGHEEQHPVPASRPVRPGDGRP